MLFDIYVGKVIESPVAAEDQEDVAYVPLRLDQKSSTTVDVNVSHSPMEEAFELEPGDMVSVVGWEHGEGYSYALAEPATATAQARAADLNLPSSIEEKRNLAGAILAANREDPRFESDQDARAIASTVFINAVG